MARTPREGKSPITRWILVGTAGLLILAAVGFFVAVPSEDLEWIRPQREGAALKILPSQAHAFHELQVSGRVVRGLRLDRRERDENAPRLVWSVNGKDVGGGQILPSGSFRRGDVVRARVESPGSDGPVVTAEASIVIANAAPHVRAAYLERSRSRPHEVTLHVQAEDPDRDPLDHEITWLLDGERWPSARGTRANIASIERGQKVQVRVVVSDGEATVEHVTAPLSVDNQPPTLEVDARPTIEDGSDGARLAVLGAASTDPDGDAVVIGAIEAPGDVRWDGARQALVWPVTDGTQTFDVVLRADDQRGGRAERTLTLRR